MDGAKRRLKMPVETADFVRSLHPHLKRKIKAAFQAVLKDPQAGKTLKDDLDRLRSFRVGRFRVIYKTAGSEEIIEVVAVGPRRTIYEETVRLLLKEKTKR